MQELHVRVNEILTPKSCSKLVIQLMKYILYNSDQIPFSYELLTRLIRSARMYLDSAGEENDVCLHGSLKEMMIDSFYRKTVKAYDHFENTFKSIESEFIDSGGVKEITLMIGTTLFNPKKVYRIRIPVLPNIHSICEMEHSFKKNMSCLGRCVFSSEELHNYSKDRVEPLNIYILLKMESGVTPKTGWFLPKENFVLPERIKHMFISLNQPDCINCSCSEEVNSKNSTSEHCELNSESVDNKQLNETEDCSSFVESNENDLFLWYQPKVNLRGFSDKKVNGMSAFTSLLHKK